MQRGALIRGVAPFLSEARLFDFSELLLMALLWHCEAIFENIIKIQKITSKKRAKIEKILKNNIPFSWGFGVLGFWGFGIERQIYQSNYMKEEPISP